MKKFILSVGLNDQETLTQLIKTDDAKKLIMETLSEYVNGATLTEQFGFYKHDDGRLTFEVAIKIELVFVKMSTVVEIVYILKNLFNQETILFETVETNSQLI